MKSAVSGKRIMTGRKRNHMSSSFLEIQNLYKTFHSEDQSIDVLRGVNLSIEKGDIFGIVGFSGAGKSTLIRCLNRLEEPDSGSIKLGDVEITTLPKKELNQRRQKIGMIFQQFNLFDSMTVRQNVAFPLENAGITKKEINKRVEEILDLVDLNDKINSYPGQLSGGQKQRVGIARALANRPDILLSDEATSALDPQTTVSVLELLKDINRKLGLTIVLITHELEVIRYTCNNMAVLENGEIVEKGRVRDIFLNPTSETGKLFVKINTEFQNNQFVEKGEGI